MTFFVDALQFYLQVNVVDAQFARFDAALQRADASIETTDAAHKEWMQLLTDQCFLSSAVVSRSLDSILRLCLRFVELVESRAALNTAVNDVDARVIGDEFDQSVSELFAVFNGADSARQTPALSQLLLTLDFNRKMLKM